MRGGKWKEDRGWEWEGSERRRVQGREKGEGGTGREGGACGRGKKGGKGNGGDKSPAWSSQDLGSTARTVGSAAALIESIHTVS